MTLTRVVGALASSGRAVSTRRNYLQVFKGFTGSSRSARRLRLRRRSGCGWPVRWTSSTPLATSVTSRRARRRRPRRNGWPRSSSSSGSGSRPPASMRRPHGLRAVPHAVSRRSAVEEVVMLDRSDVHFGRGPFGKLHVRFGKGAKGSGPRPRWVPMLDGLDLVLRWYLDDVRGRFPDSPVLLCDESGGRMAAATIRNRLRHLMSVEGLPEADWFSPHGMRRACATHNYERGVDLVAIQQLLGHWTVASTMRYVRPSETFIEDAYQRAISATLSELTRRE